MRPWPSHLDQFANLWITGCRKDCHDSRTRNTCISEHEQEGWGIGREPVGFRINDHSRRTPWAGELRCWLMLRSSVLFRACLAFQGNPYIQFYALFKYAHFDNPALNRASDLLYGVMQPPTLGLSITQFILKEGPYIQVFVVLNPTMLRGSVLFQVCLIF
jgi:hypothetical protein